MPQATEQRVFVRTSDRTQFNKCRQAWWWSYVEARQPLGRWSPALVFGDMIHRALAEYYIPESFSGKKPGKKRKRGPHPAGTFAKIYDLMDRSHSQFNIKGDDDRWINARDMGVEMMENYIDQWREEDSDIIIIFPEMPFQFDIFDPRDGKYLCTYVGTTDALIRRRSTGDIGLFEHKTAATINTDHLFIDEQAGTYWALMPEWLLREEIFSKPVNFKFMLYNYMRKGVKDQRPTNHLGQHLNLPTVQALKDECVRLGLPIPKGAKKEDLEKILILAKVNVDLLGEPSKTQPAPLFHREYVIRTDKEREMTFQRIVEHVRDMNKVRAKHPDFPHYKTPNRDCGFCEWKDLCELHEQGDDWKELRRVATSKWDPYAIHVWALDLA